jgi:hypothetical protein
MLFTCQNIIGYQECVNRAVAAGNPQDVARKSLCEDLAFAYRYGCATSEYIKGHLETKNGPSMPLVHDSPPDVLSIMIYSSEDFANVAECRADIFKCPLLRWTFDENGDQWGTEVIPFNWVPSVYDVHFMKRYYPWVGHIMAEGVVDVNASVIARRTEEELGFAPQGIVREEHRPDGSRTYIFRVRQGGQTA